MALTKVNFRMIDDRVFDVVNYGADNTGATDTSTAIQAALNAAETAGGGTVFFPKGTYLLNAPVTLTSTNKFTLDGDDCVIQFGTAFNVGNTHQLTNPITLSGNAPTELTGSITNMFGNWIQLTTCPPSDKGNRVIVCDNAAGSKWVGNNGRPTLLAAVDFADTTNNVLNFYPAIDFDTTVTNASTGEIDATDIVVYLYDGDIEVKITSGLTFKGNLLPIGTDPAVAGQAAGGASAYGLLLQRGKFRIEADFIHVNQAITFSEADGEATGCVIRGSYNGNGINVKHRSIGRINNCKITQSRHAIDVGGSTSDAASMFVSNCVLSANRDSADESIYPGENYGCIETHPAAKHVHISNSQISGGFVIASGFITIDNCHILTTVSDGAFYFRSDGFNNGSLDISNCKFNIERRQPSYNAGDGVGTFGSDLSLFEHDTPANVVTGWSMSMSNCSIKANDAQQWAAPTRVVCNVGTVQWDEIVFDSNRWYFTGTPFDEVIFRGHSDGTGHYRITNNTFYGLGVNLFRDNTLDQFVDVDVINNKIINTDSTASHFASIALIVSGLNTSDGTINHVTIDGNHIETRGATYGIFVRATNESFNIKNNTVSFIGSTLGTAIRAERNTNSTNTTFVGTIDYNQIRSNGNTITNGIVFAGLGASNYYQTGNNVIQTASTPVTTSGSAATVG